MELTFKKHPLGPSERLWLREAAQPDFFPRRGLERLAGQIPDDFRPESIDSRLYAGHRIKPIGLWLVDSQHPALSVLDKTIRAIKSRIPTENVALSLTAAELGQAIGEDEKDVALSFRYLMDFGAGWFNTLNEGAEGVKIDFGPNDMFTYYRSYRGPDDLLERAYTRVGKDLYPPRTDADTELAAVAAERCYMCGGTVLSNGVCSRCRAIVRTPVSSVHVEGVDADEVLRVTKELTTDKDAKSSGTRVDRFIERAKNCVDCLSRRRWVH